MSLREIFNFILDVNLLALFGYTIIFILILLLLISVTESLRILLGKIKSFITWERKNHSASNTNSVKNETITEAGKYLVYAKFLSFISLALLILQILFANSFYNQVIFISTLFVLLVSLVYLAIKSPYESS